MQVHNLNGTAPNKCDCGSWLVHWQRFSGQTANHCVVIGCTNPHTVGGHVQKGSISDRGWYIIPLCSSCNAKRGETFSIYDDVELVSVNVNITCRKAFVDPLSR